MNDNLIETSRKKLKELMERSFGDLKLCVLLIDGTPFRDRLINGTAWSKSQHQMR